MQAVGIDKGFWSGRRVFVTGHTGFIGGWLCAWLERLGAEIAGYALRPPTEPNFFEAFGLDRNIVNHIADIRDRESLRSAMTEFAPEIVIHLAAQPLVRQAHAHPIETFEVNVMGTANVLEVLRDMQSARAAVIMTTDKVYRDDGLDRGYRENDILGGREPYGCSKACAEHVVDAYRESYFGVGDSGPAIATVRAGNVVGGGDWARDRLIPDAVRAVVAGRPIEIRNPAAVRPWQHALDPIRGMLMLARVLAEDPRCGTGGWNFGPGAADTWPVSRVADAFTQRWGDAAEWRVPGTESAAPYEAKLLRLDSAKAKNDLGWRPRWTIERALSATVEWYRAHVAGYDVRALTFDQIAAFEGAN
jgi:CDP-glucose 4,6-dehydratase